jgi:hypothetical protein
MVKDAFADRTEKRGEVASPLPALYTALALAITASVRRKGVAA